MCRIGLDLGSSYTKGVLVGRDDEIIDCIAVKTGYNFQAAANKIISRFSEGHKIEYPVYSCGYGRECLDVAFIPHSEIIALAKAVFQKYPRKSLVIDIGGQDTKCINIREDGVIDNFKMNRKCAAGTGSFLEEIAFRLDIPPESFNELAEQATQEIKISSFCTVFAISEIVGMIKNGVSISNILMGVYYSIVERCIELAPPEESVILTGGIPQKHPMIIKLFKRVFPNTESPENAQFLAAYGTLLLKEK